MSSCHVSTALISKGRRRSSSLISFIWIFFSTPSSPPPLLVLNWQSRAGVDHLSMSRIKEGFDPFILRPRRQWWILRCWKMRNTNVGLLSGRPESVNGGNSRRGASKLLLSLFKIELYEASVQLLVNWMRWVSTFLSYTKVPLSLNRGFGALFNATNRNITCFLSLM